MTNKQHPYLCAKRSKIAPKIHSLFIENSSKIRCITAQQEFHFTLSNQYCTAKKNNVNNRITIYLSDIAALKIEILSQAKSDY